MNAAKTDLMILGTSASLRKVPDFSIELPGGNLSQSKQVKLLGVVLDPELSWDKHISQVSKKCNYILISLARFKHRFSKDALKAIIQAHVFPHILYCISVWGGAGRTQLKRIQKIA